MNRRHFHAIIIFGVSAIAASSPCLPPVAAELDVPGFAPRSSTVKPKASPGANSPAVRWPPACNATSPSFAASASPTLAALATNTPNGSLARSRNISRIHDGCH